ncbi:hypothetical protein DEO23_14145 [Brachybacterium endophyticum]|uniref:PD-(D/E)XK endonuclease-like domain-containing protein n=1 Tax=Brachybacterium endophyticum TaxID=2182385 RepID=A0A2U2RH84_9MICO|nr:hypothetical protein [Brachybacterium endophyticum]PWH05217.1 hypothetical protein DEO23_14145 [Brachybacterium endophyticum]
MTTLEQLLGHNETADTRTDMLTLIENSIRRQPRSMQKLIGPSEIGTDCTHCLAAKVAGWEETQRDTAWLPMIGTAVHAALAEFFEADNRQSLAAGRRARWRPEHRVEVGSIGPHHISGTCDLYDTATGTVVDFKIVGAETLRTAKAAPKPVYRTQVHLYGRGYENAGHTPERVMIAHLPRNAVSLTQAVIFEEPYDRTVALEALERANRVHANVTTLASISEAARDEWITSQPRADGCFSCRRYPDWATQPSRLATELGLTNTRHMTRKAA